MASSLQTGSRGPTVATLQAKLNAAVTPSPKLVPDGVFGAKTAQAVKSFQQRKGLKVDGVVGPMTSAALGISLPGGHAPPGGGGHAPPAPPRGGPPAPPAPPAPPGAPPSAFVDLSIFNVVIEAIIGGYQKIGGALLSWIDSDYVPQFVYDQASSGINGIINGMASQLRGITRNVVTMGQDPAAFVTGRIRDIMFPRVNALSSALQPLTALPVIGGVARAHQQVLAGILSVADTALSNMRNNGQSAQAVATQIAAALDSIARRIR